MRGHRVVLVLAVVLRLIAAEVVLQLAFAGGRLVITFEGLRCRPAAAEQAEQGTCDGILLRWWHAITR
ncbi:hypothetical protein GCM10023195_36370 [Actinoallomurus liliacearum]|uniref:Secreted protein n=1 Tax=Actinoallomurus liliacearum TaxID=1080073 RepID=A0ABP8TNQ3_9ACTN